MKTETRLVVPVVNIQDAQTVCACVFKFNCFNLPAAPSTQHMLVLLRQRQH